MWKQEYQEKSISETAENKDSCIAFYDEPLPYFSFCKFSAAALNQWLKSL